MNWRFDLDGVEIDEPIGMDEFTIAIMRDERWHGVFIEASASRLQFYGDGYRILKAAKEADGVDANVIFTASVKCEGESEYSTAISGRLNFGMYKEDCGDTCLISLNVEQDTCAMVFKNRFDQKVNIDSNLAFDKITLLEDYEGLGFNLPLATQVVPISTDGEVVPAGDDFELTDLAGSVSAFTLVRPIYGIVNDNSISTGQLDNPASVYQQNDGPVLISPQVLLEENEDCILTNWNYDVRMKGTIRLIGDNAPSSGVSIVFGHWDGSAIIYNVITDIEPEFTIANPMVSGQVYNFDRHYTGSVAIPEGNGVYMFIKQAVVGLDDRTYDIHFDQETNFKLWNDRQCPATSCEVYLVNELLARCTEAITDRCLTIKSDYYGRSDSEPYASDTDGCGGLRVLTNGLKVRQAEEKLLFASMEEVMNGLRAIDNIGMGMEPNTEVGTGEWVRIEPAEYFYQDVKILDLPYIPKAASELQDQWVYSNIRYGYNNWEIKSTKGIDEFNSYKERRTGIKSVNNELDITTDMIASGYIIENLRTSTLAITGETDNSYDNDIFIICVDRDTTPQVRESFFGTGTPGTFFFAKAEGQFLQVGSVVNVSGTSLNNGNLTITLIVEDNWGYYFTVAEATVTESFVNATFTGVSGYFGLLVVEQNIASSPANFYSPTTAYNWRIRPLYNLMRWFKSIAQCYVNLNNTTSKLFFTFGKGNYLAEGQITDSCALENKVMAENSDLSKYDYLNAADYLPIHKPEIISFTYPLSVADYMLIKVTPYGYLNVQCGNGDYEKAYIKSINYSPVRGSANFILVKKWQ